MTDKVRVIRVFIGSPSGLEEERQNARDVVNEVNLSHSENWGIQFKLVGWEDTIPGYQRPQSKINQDLDKCEYFVGILWDRWGSKPSTEKDGYSSGFEEEFYRAKSHHKTGRMKDLAMYFKHVDIPDGLKPKESLQKVLDFRQDCIDKKEILFQQFNDINEFKDLFRNKLFEIGWREVEKSEPIKDDDDKSEPQSVPDSGSVELGKSDSRLIDSEAVEFISSLCERASDWAETGPHEIARFRLIASSIRRSGNDNEHLGNHDANLVFRHYRNFQLSADERTALIDCGIAGYEYQNVPLWRWISHDETDGDYFRRVRRQAIIGSGNEAANAIKLLDLCSQELPVFDNELGKEFTLSSWTSNNATDAVFNRAIEYLSKRATKDDLSAMEVAKDSASSTRVAQLESAIVAILARSNLQTAIKKLKEYDAEKVEPYVVDLLKRNKASLTTQELEPLLSAKSDSLRLAITKILFERNAISLESARTLFSDTVHEIRLYAAESLTRLGESPEPEQLKKALTIEQKKATGLGIFFGNSGPDAKYYDQYEYNRLTELSTDQLVSIISGDKLFVENELSVLYGRHRKKYLSEMRINLKDGFRQFLSNRSKTLEEKGIFAEALSKELEKLQTFLALKHINYTITRLCDAMDPSDINLVRRTLDKNEIDLSDPLAKYLIRFGDWSDIDRILKMRNFQVYQPESHKLSSEAILRIKALAILEIGKNRIADVLTLDIDHQLRNAIAIEIPNVHFKKLSDDFILKELNRNDDDNYRAIISMQCILALTKSRVSAILDRYVDSEDQRYYNSIHWLDLGVTMPSKLAKDIAKQRLAEL